MTYAWYDFVGNIGVLMIVIAYGGLQMDKLSTKQAAYHLLNGIGALLILVSLYFAFNLSSFIIEIVWLVISLYGLWRWAAGRKLNDV